MAVVDRKELLRLLTKYQRFVLTTHVNPDGDAIGSELAFASLISDVVGAGAEVRIVNRDPVPPQLAFLDPEGIVEVYEPSTHGPVIAGAQVIVGLDNSVPERFASMADSVRESAAIRICIDHHPEPSAFWDFLLVDETASCTGQIVHDLFRLQGVEPGVDMATALYVALVSDTGRYRFGNTSAEALTMAAELVRSGARPASVYARLEETMSPSYLKLLGRVLSSVESHSEGRVMILRATSSMQDDCDSRDADMGEIINLALKAETSHVSALFREVGPHQTKVSLRSKGELDVNRLAREHGGGGHRNASGIVLDEPLESAVAKLLPGLTQMVDAAGPGVK